MKIWAETVVNTVFTEETHECVRIEPRAHSRRLSMTFPCSQAAQHTRAAKQEGTSPQPRPQPPWTARKWRVSEPTHSRFFYVTVPFRTLDRGKLRHHFHNKGVPDSGVLLDRDYSHCFIA